MHPTIEEQLDGARRLLQRAGDDAGLAPGAQELLTDARRLLDTVSRSWAKLGPFYRADNAAMTDLLSRAGAQMPPELRPRLVAPASADDADDPVSAGERNSLLRDLLAYVIISLPDQAPVRSEIATYLRARVDADPS